jgi:hypothetical protein
MATANMNLTDTQKQQVAKWIADGAKLSDIQKRITSELGLSLTYMEVRMLVDDLKLMPKDPAPTSPPESSVLGKSAAATPGGPSDLGAQPAAGESLLGEPDELPPAAGGNVSVTVDTIARPGSMVSGGVKFSDGQTATWYLDQMGRLGLAAKQQGYRPSAADLQSFQQALERELSRMGL